jgi:hypothetical protein
MAAAMKAYQRIGESREMAKEKASWPSKIKRRGQRGASAAAANGDSMAKMA